MQSWHHVLDNYIKNTGKWKTAKDDIQSIYEDNLTIKDIQNPTRNKEVLEQFSDWLETDARKIRMEKHMKDAADETFIPDASYMDTASMYVLEEVIVCSGCRPVVFKQQQSLQGTYPIDFSVFHILFMGSEIIYKI